jgi:predicted dehydrogenase
MSIDSRPFKVGLYGAGAFGRFVVQSLAQSAEVRVAAVASRTLAHAEALARDEGVRSTHKSFEALLADNDLDLVIIATPPAEHAAQAIAAVQAGKHVFVEKPLATSLDAAERLINEAASRKLVVAVDYPMLYSPLVEAATLFNSSRLMGPLLRISVENIASCRGLDDSHWFWNRDISGGIFVEHGVHFFDWCGRIAGNAQRVVALTAAHGIREDRVFSAVAHASGTMASYYHAFVAQPDTERTRAVLSYEGVDVILDGWIPTRLHMSGHSAAVATTTVRRMLRRTVESIPDPTIGFYFDAGPKQELYAQCVRAAVEDMGHAIREPGYVARNDARKALPSLRMAVGSREAARTGAAVELDSTRTATLP